MELLAWVESKQREHCQGYQHGGFKKQYDEKLAEETFLKKKQEGEQKKQNELDMNAKKKNNIEENELTLRNISEPTRQEENS